MPSCWVLWRCPADCSQCMHVCAQLPCTCWSLMTAYAQMLRASRATCLKWSCMPQEMLELRQAGFVKGGTTGCCIIAEGETWYDEIHERFDAQEAVRHRMLDFMVSSSSNNALPAKDIIHSRQKWICSWYQCCGVLACLSVTCCICTHSCMEVVQVQRFLLPGCMLQPCSEHCLEEPIRLMYSAVFCASKIGALHNL